VTYLWLTIAFALIAVIAIALDTSDSRAKTRARTTTAAKPTVVLVNGAWANNAAWSAEGLRGTSRAALWSVRSRTGVQIPVHLSTRSLNFFSS